MNIFFNEVKTMHAQFINIQFNYFGISIIVVIVAVLIVTFSR